MNVAVFADVHGRILLAFMLCARWQRETGERIDLILQAGDLAAFPDPARMDRATVRHGERDPNELGFMHDFTQPNEDVRARLAATDCPMIFVRGNHEDHLWLDQLEARATGPLFPVDPYERIFCLRTGMPYTLTTADASLDLLGIGRIGAPHPDSKSSPHRPKYAREWELARLDALGHKSRIPVDALLTHDIPPRGERAGLPAIRAALDRYRPIYHFYGHTEEAYRQDLDRNGVTTTLRLADLNWETPTGDAPLRPGAMGLLRWESRERHSFEVIDAPWLADYTRFRWRTAE